MKTYERKAAGEKKVFIAGIGPGNAGFITPIAMRVIEGCDVLIGGRRNLDLFKFLKKEEVIIDSELEQVSRYILENMEHKSICVLATGDPGIYSISRYLKNRLKDVELETIPGISSLQYLCSRMGMNWNDMAILSMHGREEDKLPGAVGRNSKTAIFTGGGTSPADVCKLLMSCGIYNALVTVGERLSYPDERIVSGIPEELSRINFDSLSLMIVENSARCGQYGHKRWWEFRTPGIPDSLFLRGDVPMTKEEVRTIALSKLRLEEDSIVYDIGAGTGSVSIECAMICRRGEVYAVERNSEAVALIYKNIDKFAADNISVIEGDAPLCLDGLPVPDRVFIGGTGGHMEDILGWVAANTKEARVVVSAVSPESVYEAVRGLEKLGFKDIELVNVAVSRGCKAGDRHIMKAMNPIYIVSAGQVNERKNF